MGSHYIPVGKLKIDKSILDIACPAAGYGETPPDPAIFCPANGYSQPFETWEPPVVMPEPGTDQILLLCDDLEQGVLALYCKANTGNVLVEVLSTDMIVLWSAAAANTHRFSLPTIGTGTYYVVRLRPETAGSYITDFYKTTYSGYNTDYRILQARFNTPQIVTLNTAFDGMTSIKKCEFLSNMNSLTTMAYCFRGTPIESVVYPEEMNSLLLITSLYHSTTDLKICDLRNFPIFAVTNMMYLISASNVEELHFPANLPNVTTMQNIADASRSLIKVTMFIYAPLMENMQAAFRNCVKLKQAIKLPPLPNLIDAGYFTQNTPITKLEFEGPSNNCTSMRDLVNGCSLIEELILPTSLNSVNNTGVYQMWLSAFKIKRIQLPTAMPLLTPNPSNFINTTNVTMLEELTECANWGTGSFIVRFYGAKLTSLYQPALRASNLQIGQSTARSICTSIEIDWANSVFATGTCIYLYVSNMTAAEVNRIFSALPVVVGSYDFRLYGPAFATCDKTIATAKGWIVNGSV